MKSTCLLGIYFLFLMMLICQSAGSEPISQQNAEQQVSTLVQDGGFERCWQRFRNDALHAPERLPEMMVFPLMLKGELDDEPQRVCNPEQLRHSWQAIMDAVVFVLGDDDTLVKTSRREYLQRHAVLSKEMIRLAGKNQLRVGDFVFEKMDQHWRVEKIYTNLEDVACPVAK